MNMVRGDTQNPKKQKRKSFYAFPFFVIWIGFEPMTLSLEG